MNWTKVERGIARGLPDNPGNKTLRFAVSVMHYCDENKHARDPYNGGGLVLFFSTMDMDGEWEIEYQRGQP